MEQSNSQIIYIGDPMCSWCYGISKELQTVKSLTEKNLDFKMMMGGLRPHGKESIADLSDFLKEHWNSVSLASGLSFNYNILDKKDFIYNTEPPSRACIVVRNMHPDKEFTFYHLVQKAFYYDNIDVCKIDNYASICNEMGINFIKFQENYNSVEYKKMTTDEFIAVRELKISSFPTVIFRHNDRFHLIAKGFANSKTMMSRIQEVIN